MTKRQAWKIYDSVKSPGYHWENPGSRRGLMLATCNGCGEGQTRETYVSGFWRDHYTLVQSESITAIAQHRCGVWHRNDD